MAELKVMAENDRRSVSNFVGVLITKTIDEYNRALKSSKGDRTKFTNKRRFQKKAFDDWGENGVEEIVYETGYLDDKDYSLVLLSEKNKIQPLVEHAPQMFNELASVYEAMLNIQEWYADQIGDRPKQLLQLKIDTVLDLLKRIDMGQSGAEELPWEDEPRETVGG